MDQMVASAAPPQPREARLSRYQAYLERDPHNAALLVALGDLHHESGAFDRALDCFQRCLDLHPDDAAAAGRKAGVLLSLHRFGEAQALLERLCAAQPGAAALHFNRGLALYCQQRWAEALAAFDQARGLGLRHRELARYRAYALHHLGRLDAAIESCAAWLEHEPEGGARAYLAVLEMDRGDLASAWRRAGEVLARDPEDTDAALVAGMCLAERQDVAGARAHFDRLLAREPDNARGWFGMGLAHLYQGEHAQAIAALERALAATPDHAGTLVTLGWARFTSRDLLGAEQVFRRAIAADRNFGEAHGGLALTLVFQNRRTEARREATLARKLNPQGFGAVWAHAALLALEGRREQGEAEVAAALGRSVTSDGRTLFEHMQAYLRRQAARPGASLPSPSPPDNPP